MTKSTTHHLREDKWQEVERLKAAADRLVRRAQEDPEVARGFLRDIGYYEMMGKPDPGNSDTATPAKPTKQTKAISSRKTSTRKPTTRKKS